MLQISTNEFRAKMAKTFNKVDAESETLLVKRKDLFCIIDFSNECTVSEEEKAVE